MHAPRRKTFNTVNAASLARWIVITAFLGLVGLVYVYLNLQLYRQGDRKKALENELVSIRAQSDVTTGQIAALTSRSAMQRRLKEGYLKMIPIAEHNIVRLSLPTRALGDDAVQPVANKRTGR
jgi:hypothetical protein